MVIKQEQRFNNFAQSCGNRFLAVKVISKWARELGEQFKEYRISESKLLDTVLSGRCFYSEAQMKRRKINSTPDHIDDFLSWKLDQRIVEEVKRMYSLSIRSGQGLLLSNNSKFTQGELTKINVLLKMIWYSEEPRKGEKKVDTYLESLVLKSDAQEIKAIVDVPEDIAKEVADIAFSGVEVATEVKEALDEMPIDIAVGPRASETKVAESVESVDGDIVEDVPEDIVAKYRPEALATNTDNKTIEKVDLDRPTSVINIRIYNVPDFNTPSKIFSGNVIPRKKVADMTEIEYVKPGFGLVKGFTLDLK